MSPANRTAKQIAEIRRDMERGKLASEVGEKRIKSLEAQPPVFRARWTLPNGKERTKDFTGKGAEKKAVAYEAEQRAKIKSRDYSDPAHLKTTIAEILSFYLENRMKGKESLKNARAHVRDILEVWGDRLTLGRLDQDPDNLITELRDALELKMMAKSAWNRKVTAQAALGYYILKKRLRVVNPFPGADWPQPESKRSQAPEFRDALAMVKEAKKEKHPYWCEALFICGWEHALRMGEYLSWRWEGLTLDPTGNDLPWARTKVLKQGRPVWRELPLTLDAAAALRSMRVNNKETGPVFPLKRCMTDRYVRRVLDASGNPGYNFHDFRRSWKRRHPHLSQRQRMEALGQKTEKADEHYLLEMERKELEDIMRPTFEGPGHFRDTDFESGESA